MALVLVVEDDLSLRMLHARVLSKVEGSVVVTAASLAEANEVLEHEVPDAIVLDLRLGDGHGIDLIEGLERQNARPLVVVVSSFLEDVDSRALPHERFFTLTKPADPDRLRAIVTEHFGRAHPPQPFCAAEYVQLACLGGHSLQLGVTTPEQSGSITIIDGHVWAAWWGEETGVEAFTQAVHARDAHVELAMPMTPPRRQVAGNWQELLIEAARRADENASDGTRRSLRPDELDFSDVFEEATTTHAEAGSVPEKPAVQPKDTTSASKPSSGEGDLIAEGVRAVIARRYADAVVLLERALELHPASESLKHRLSRLRELGY